MLQGVHLDPLNRRYTENYKYEQTNDAKKPL